MTTREQWLELACKVGETVAEKNAAYGDSVRNSARIVQILYPNGISVEQVPAMLVVVRVLDKLSRIANDPGFGGEDPALDISGYGLLLQELIQNGLEPGESGSPLRDHRLQQGHARILTWLACEGGESDSAGLIPEEELSQGVSSLKDLIAWGFVERVGDSRYRLTHQKGLEVTR